MVFIRTPVRSKADFSTFRASVVYKITAVSLGLDSMQFSKLDGQFTERFSKCNRLSKLHKFFGESILGRNGELVSLPWSEKHQSF